MREVVAGSLLYSGYRGHKNILASLVNVIQVMQRELVSMKIKIVSNQVEIKI